MALVFTVGVLNGTILISRPSIAVAGCHINTYTVAQLDNHLKLALATDLPVISAYRGLRLPSYPPIIKSSLLKIIREFTRPTPALHRTKLDTSENEQLGSLNGTQIH